MTSSAWVGFAISAYCGETLGHYQGIVVECDKQTVTLERVFRNGLPYSLPKVTLNGEYIKDMKIISLPEEKKEPTMSTVIILKPQKKNFRRPQNKQWNMPKTYYYNNNLKKQYTPRY